MLAQMTSGVLFDLYETVVTERATNPTRAGSLGVRLGLDVTAFRKAWIPQRARVIRGQITFADALIEIAAMLGRTVDTSVVCRLSAERRLEKAAVFQTMESDAIKVLRQLHERGFKLAVVSNCFAEDIEGWYRCSASECFDASVFSFEVGAAKPEPEIYRVAMQRLGVECSQAVFIGDGGDDELLGAERAGLRAAQATWFRSELDGLPPHISQLSSWSSVLEFATTAG
jgi:putative hydrolase of the HAD superfamily